MTKNYPRWSRMLVAGIALEVVSLMGLMLVSGRLAAAEASDATDTASPVLVEKDAVTLELFCRGDAAKGTFNPVHARMLEATPWGTDQQSQASLSGYEEKPGGPGNQAKRGKAKPVITVLATLKPEGDAVLEIDTPAGKAAISLQDVDFDKPKSYMDGKIDARRLPSATRIAAAPGDNDYPAAARGRDGAAWVAYVTYQRGGEPDMEAAKKNEFASLVPSGNGDQIRLVKFDGKQWSAAMPVTEPLLDLWKPTVAVDGSGKVWVAWSQNSGDNWDIYRRSYDPAANQWSPVERMTTEPGADINVVSATDAKGNVWWAWQGRREKHFQIFLLGQAQTGAPIAVTANAANHWDPAIAADSKGNVYVAWDSYENGNYDVFLRPFRGAEPQAVIPVATTSDYETRVSLAVDGQDRLWIGYEQGGANWGKDFGRMVPVATGQTSPAQIDAAGAVYGAGVGRPVNSGDGVGIPLYADRRVMVKCYADGRMQQPAVDPSSAWELSAIFPAFGPWRDVPADKSAERNEMSRPKSFARMAVGGDGRVWLFFRHHPLPGGGGEDWAEYVMSYDGQAWSKPRRLANSDNLLDNRPALVPCGADGVLAVYSSDYRLRGAFNGERNGSRPLKTDLYAALLSMGGAVAAPQLAAAPAGAATVKPVHAQESQDIQRMRDFRVESAGKTYQLIRGEFHRHTEYSAHRDTDGSLEDMWRYSQDAADMDWMGNADHDNGMGHQYAWWIIQKTACIYHNPPWFVAPYTYERSVGYPNGHRNVIFARRGIRTLPRGDLKSGDENSGTPDTKMLYAYLKQFGGICASHTSATGMGTDWRDNDPLVEPVVEIYQGDRNNYECEGVPRGYPVNAETVGLPQVWEKPFPKGYVWNALAKGYRFGFESSSDHISTHSSYGVALVDKPGRQALVDAFRARRCFAATDNILLVMKCAGHLMGEEFTLPGKPTLEIQAQGTGSITKLDIIRNNRYVYSASPNTATVDMRWTDFDPPTSAVNYYYVRIQQADTNLAWGSPVWIHTKAP